MKKAVLVEPEIAENTGFIARLAANYNTDLRIVNPDFNLEEARKTASSGQEKLREATIFNTVKEAVEDLEYIVGTKPDRGISVNKFQPRDNTSVMIGRESSGLKKSELEKCEATVNLGLPGYSSMNQSHATAIFFHELSQNNTEGMTAKQKKKIQSLAPENIGKAVNRSNPSKKQAGKIIKELIQQKE